MGYRLGIDIGTTFTAAAFERDGETSMLSLGSQQSEMPSVVALSDGEVLVGDAAQRAALRDPTAVAREFKRRIGDSTSLIVSGEPWSAEALTAQLLAHVLASAKVLNGSPASTVVLTHPAAWLDFKLDRFRQAALIADCEEAVFVPEPVAAARHYASRRSLEVGQRVAVFDFGGATFDAAVLETGSGDFTVLGKPKGLEQLGGMDLDEAVFSHVLSAAGIELDRLEDEPATRRSLHRLRDDCRAAKEALSSDTAAHVPIMLPGHHTDVRITRTEFEAVARRPIDRAVKLVAATVRDAGLETADIDAVLLVGGSSRIPYVAQAIGQSLGLPVVADEHPKHTICRGAVSAQGGALPVTKSRGSRSQLPPAPPRIKTTPTISGRASSPPPERSVLPPPQAERFVGPPIEASSVVDDPTQASEREPSVRDQAEAGDLAPVSDQLTVGDSEGAARLTPPVPGADLVSSRSRRGLTRVAVAVMVLLVAAASVVIANRPATDASGQLAVTITADPDAATDESVAPGEALESTETSIVRPERFVDTIAVGSSPRAPLAHAGHIWVPNAGSGTVTVIDASRREVVDTITVGDEPLTPIAHEGHVWVSNARSDTITVINAETREVTANIAAQRNPASPVADDRLVWITNRDDGTVTVVNSETSEEIGTIPDVALGRVTTAWRQIGGFLEEPIAHAGYLWVPVRVDGLVAVISTETLEVVVNVDVGILPGTPVAVGDQVWVPSELSGTITVIDADTREIVDTVDVGGQLGTPVSVAGLVWVSDERSGTVAVIDADTREIVDTVRTGEVPGTPVAVEGQVWVPNELSGTITVIDADTRQIVDSVAAGDRPSRPVAEAGHVWVSNRGAGTVTVIEASADS